MSHHVPQKQTFYSSGWRITLLDDGRGPCVLEIVQGECGESLGNDAARGDRNAITLGDTKSASASDRAARLPDSSETTAPGEWWLDMLWQPVDDRGLAAGFGTPIHRTLVKVSMNGTRPSSACIRLPTNISFELARQCYYRITHRRDS